LNQQTPIVDIRNLDYSVSGRAIFSGLDMDFPSRPDHCRHGAERHR
jgi:hypothetical protein